MTEIKLYLTAEQRVDMLKFYQTILTDGEGNERDFSYNSMDVRNDVIKLLVDTSSLLTTIESQKEEIEEFRERYTDSQFHVKALSDVENVHIAEIQSLKAITELKNAEIERLNELTGKDTRQIAYLLKELESQRAITELAVKGLKEVSHDIHIGSTCAKIAKSTLSEIERLQSE